MVKPFWIVVLTMSATVAAGHSFAEGEQTPIIESADYSSCESGDAAACDRVGDAYVEQAGELRSSGEMTEQVKREFATSLALGKNSWIKACSEGFAISCSKLGNYYLQTSGRMQAVRAYNRGCTLGHDAACTLIQNFKDENSNESLPCNINSEKYVGAVPWLFEVYGSLTEMYAPGFSLDRQLSVQFGEKHRLIHNATVQEDEISRFVFQPDWLNTLVRSGDLKIDYIGERNQSDWGFRLTGNESGTQALLAQFGSGEAISYTIDFSNSPYGSRVQEHQSGEISPRGYPQAREYARALAQIVQEEADQGLCNPEL